MVCVGKPKKALIESPADLATRSVKQEDRMDKVQLVEVGDG